MSEKFMVEVFSVSLAEERATLGERITAWCEARHFAATQVQLRQSSDSRFHCLTAVVTGVARDENYTRYMRRPAPVGFSGECYFDSLKIFSATKHRDRAEMGDAITAWLAERGLKHDDISIEVLQSSDAEYHCVTIAVFYNEVQS